MLKTVLWVSLLKLYLITRYNPRVLNPGPPSKQTSLSVYYQNVQGLIPFTYLAENHPKFDEIKLCEIHSYFILFKLAQLYNAFISDCKSHQLTMTFCNLI